MCVLVVSDVCVCACRSFSGVVGGMYRVCVFTCVCSHCVCVFSLCVCVCFMPVVCSFLVCPEGVRVVLFSPADDYHMLSF